MRVNSKHKEYESIGVGEKIAYGLGEMGTQFSWGMISSYLTLFYTDVVGLAPTVISAIMILARVWDAINDPMFGVIAENTKTRWGKFRPYILFGAPILALFSSLTFLNLDIPPVWKAIWCAVTYIGCGMAYTAVGISVGCLANSMTASNKERVSLNALRGVLGSLSSMLIGAITMPMILYFGNGSTSTGHGFFMAALIFALVSIPCLMICGCCTREVVGTKPRRAHKNTTLALIRAFVYIFKDRNARLLILICTLFTGHKSVFQ